MSKLKFFVFVFQLFVSINWMFASDNNALYIPTIETIVQEYKILNNAFLVDTLKQKRELRLSFQMLGPNHILSNPKEQPRLSLLGMWGVGIRGEYHYNERNAFAFSYLISGVHNSFLEYKDKYAFNASTDLALLHFRKTKKVALGYGITFNRKSWKKKTTFEQSEILIENGSNYSFGIAAMAKYRLWKSFFATFNYAPSFIMIHPDGGDLRYQHSISIGLIATGRIFENLIK